MAYLYAFRRLLIQLRPTRQMGKLAMAVAALPVGIYVWNDHKSDSDINFFEAFNKALAVKTYEPRLNFPCTNPETKYGIWVKNDDLNSDQFRKHVHYEINHPIMKYVRRRILSKELPQYYYGSKTDLLNMCNKVYAMVAAYL